jgi:hypothetical protein
MVMRINKVVVAFIMTFVSICAFAKIENTKPVKKIKLKDLSIHQGLFIEWNKLGSIADFKTLAPQSVLLKTPTDDFMQGSGTSTSGNTAFSFLLGFQLLDKQKNSYKSNPYLRLGVSYYSITSITTFATKDERRTVDTLTSAQTGKTIYIDSLTTQILNLNYTTSQLRFDGSLLMKTNLEKRWLVYTGIGLTAGLSLNATTEIYYNKYYGSQTIDAKDGGLLTFDYSYTSNTKSEKFKNRPTLGGSVYIPIGVTFRLGNKRAFWKHTHLYYEFRPGMNITNIPALRTIANTSLHHGLGLRWAL